MDSTVNWQELLAQLNEDFFASHDADKLGAMLDNNEIDATAINHRWLGYPSAANEAIAAKELLLGIQLPPSYRSFLAASNGFRFVSVFLDNLFPVETIAWAKDAEDEWWFDMLEDEEEYCNDEKYFDYGKAQSSVWFRGEYFRQSLKVSHWDEGMCIFLNPLIKHGEEWEVLVYGTWFPGAHRYRSFYEFMLDTHERNDALNEDRPYRRE
jgi:hypothetical protein